MVKTTGIEFKAYMNDDKWWPEGQYTEGYLISVDGVESWDFDLDEISDTALVKVLEGYICNDDDLHRELTIATHFKRWLKAQKTCYLLAAVDKTKVSEVKELLKTVGCKVLN